MQGVFLDFDAIGVNDDFDVPPMRKLPGIDIVGGSIEAFLDGRPVSIV
ncbi:MAG: hypothetical protein WB783_19895 [Arenicellales bacterium]